MSWTTDVPDRRGSRRTGSPARCNGAAAHGERAEGRVRGLLPTPPPPCEARREEEWRQLSRGCRRRISERICRQEMVRDALQRLNELHAGGGEPGGTDPHLSGGQEYVLSRIRLSVDAMGGPPGDLSITDALRELQIGNMYERASGRARSFGSGAGVASSIRVMAAPSGRVVEVRPAVMDQGALSAQGSAKLGGEGLNEGGGVRASLL